MGLRGPRKKPAAVERAQGYPRKRKGETDRALAADVEHDGDAGAAGTVAVPAPPAWLGKQARKIWRSVAGDLARRLVIKSSDHTQLARYCEYVDIWNALIDGLRDSRTGRPVTSYKSKSASGATMIRVHPDYRSARDLDRTLRDMERAFGLDPTSRPDLYRRIKETRDADPDGRPLDTLGARQSRPGSPVGILRPQSPPLPSPTTSGTKPN